MRAFQMFGRYSGRDQGRLVFDRRKIPLLIGIAVLGPLFILSTPLWAEGLQRTIQILGICAIVVCIIGRTWCSSFITGHKTYELMKVGPYSVIRHPLYAFSIIGAAGVGAQSGTVLLTAISGVYLAIVLHRRILDEEREMIRIHGDAYRAYMTQVPRLLPRVSPWRPAGKHAPGRQAVLRTFIDSCYLLLAIPFAEILQHLQRVGSLHAVLWLP